MNAENTTVINPENYSAIPCNQEKLPKVSFHEFRYTLDTDNGPVRFDTQCFRKNFSGKQDGAENSDEITFSMNISEEDEHFYVQPTLS